MTITSYFPAKQHAGALQVLREDTHKQKGMLTYWGSHRMIIFHEQSNWRQKELLNPSEYMKKTSE